MPSRLISTSIILVAGTVILYTDVDPAEPQGDSSFWRGEDKDVAYVSRCYPCRVGITSTAPAQHLNGSRPDETRQAPIQQGGRESVRALLRRVSSRIAMPLGVDRGRSSARLRVHLNGDLDAAGPVVAACASVESLQLLISPEVCPGETEALFIALERPSHQLTGTAAWPNG